MRWYVILKAVPALVVVHIVINTFTLKIYKPISNGFSARNLTQKKKDVVSGVVEYQSSGHVRVMPIQPQLSPYDYVPVNALSRRRGIDHWSLIIHYRSRFRETSSQRLKTAAALMDQLLEEYTFIAVNFDNVNNSSKGVFLTEPKFVGAKEAILYPTLCMTELGIFAEGPL